MKFLLFLKEWWVLITALIVLFACIFFLASIATKATCTVLKIKDRELYEAMCGSTF